MVAPNTNITAIIINLLIIVIMCSDYTLFSERGVDPIFLMKNPLT